MADRLSLEGDLPTLLAPTRVTLFADRPIRRGKRTVMQGVAWQGWNPDPLLELRMARLPGSGSFYWPGAVRAYSAVRAMMRADATIRQAKIETISGREIARVYKEHMEVVDEPN